MGERAQGTDEGSDRSSNAVDGWWVTQSMRARMKWKKESDWRSRRGVLRQKRSWFFDGRLPKGESTEGTCWDWLMGLEKLNPATGSWARRCDTLSELSCSGTPGTVCWSTFGKA